MASRGWNGITATDIARLQQRGSATPKRPKYGNVKIQTPDGPFDSKREYAYWLELKARQQAGEIRELRRQVAYSLHCPAHEAPGVLLEVCSYRADFVWIEAQTGDLHVQDVKGHAGTVTALYALKRKWMALEHGVTIEEIS